MGVIPDNPKIYHITHLNNLPSIAEAGALYSDEECRRIKPKHAVVGMSAIKQRRLTELPVLCHRGTKVGEYVPFYFCPRSVMLYILYMGNHPDITYRDGQRPIVHLQADLQAVVRWAENNRINWAFSDCNAGASFARFYADYGELAILDWKAIGSTDFRPVKVKEAKQAEFLVYGSLPWSLIDEIGVIDGAMAVSVREALRDATVCPPIRVRRDWYY